MRFIIIIIATALVFFIVKKTVARLFLATSNAPKQAKESILPCDYCQVHIPASEAIKHGENYFCKHEHADAWLEQNSKNIDKE